jgi:hypothetical protein
MVEDDFPRALREAERIVVGGIITRHLEDLAEVAEDPEWVYEDWLAAQVASGLVGLQSAGKTWFMLTEASALSLGLPLPIGRENGKGSRDVAGRGVAFLLWLDAPERQLKLRLGNIYEAMIGDRLPQGATIAHTLEPVSVFEKEWWLPLIDALRDEEDRFGVPARYLGIDHAFHLGINVKDFASGISEFQRGLPHLRSAFPHLATRLLIHSPKGVNWGTVKALGARAAIYGGVRSAQAMDATAIVEMAGPDPTRNYRALAVQSRDLPAQELIAVSFGTDRHVFNLRMENVATLHERNEETERKASSQSFGKYLAAIEELGDRASGKQIAGAAGVSHQAAAKALKRMAEEGAAYKDGRGIWRVGEEAEAESPQGELGF